ncbi:hypothetical protein RI367_002886 [Sorochytrium milnesiophthora]
MRLSRPLQRAISSVEFANALQRFDLQPQEKFVSGGADSVALACLLHRYAPHRVHAVTVNHNLRPESTAEVERVKHILDTQGIRCTSVAIDWSSERLGGEIPRPAVREETARNERYRQLADYCSEHGISKLFVGHHLNDQIETVLFRLGRSTGIFGLGGMLGMAELPVKLDPRHAGIQLVRPLLAFPKARMVDTCKELGIQWIEDPSNADHRYQRNVIRSVLGELDTQVPAATTVPAVTIDSLTQLCQHTAMYSADAKARVKELYDRYVLHDPKTGTAFLHLDVDRRGGGVHWFLQNRYTVYHLLSEIVRWVSCLDQAPRLQTVVRLYENMRSAIEAKPLAPKMSTQCVERCVIMSPQPDRNGRRNWIFASQPPSSGRRPKSAVKLTKFDEPVTFEDRYFVTLRPPSLDLTDPGMQKQMSIFHRSTQRYLPPGLTAAACGLTGAGAAPRYQLVVRYFNREDYDSFSGLLRERRHSHTAWLSYRRAFEHYMNKMPVLTRFVVPVVAVVGVDQPLDRVVAIPCIGVNLAPDLFSLDIAYRAATFSQSQSAALP